jgi:hypothetical protein
MSQYVIILHAKIQELEAIGAWGLAESFRKILITLGDTNEQK